MSDTPKTAEARNYDYEYLGHCMFPGGYQGSNGQEADCSEYAIGRIWWENYDDAWLACPEHFQQVTGQPTSTLEARLQAAETVLGDIAAVEIDDSPQPLYAAAAAHAECVFRARAYFDAQEGK